MPGPPGSGRLPAAIVEQTEWLLDDHEDLSRPLIHCFAYRTDNAKVLEWHRESFPLSPRTRQRPGTGGVLERALERSEEYASLCRKALKKLYPREGKGNRKALDGQIRSVLAGYWAGLAEPFRHMVLELDGVGVEPDEVEARWSSRSARRAGDAFEGLVDSLDANAEALRRAAEARRFFYGALKKTLPLTSPT